MPSESQLVKKFGASRPTVARALRTLEAEGLVHRRAGSGTFASKGSNGQRSGTRTLAQNAMATLVKVGATSWIIAGLGVT